MYSHLLVPLDGSEYSERALSHAHELAKAGGGKVSLLSVIRRPSTHVPEVAELDEQSKERAMDYLAPKAESLKDIGDVKTNVEIGEPAEVITEYSRSKGVDLIVMSTHGIGATGKYALGSVAMKVLMTAPCPVFMVRIDNPQPQKAS